MKTPYPRRLAIAAGIFSVVLLSQVATAELVVRLVEDPKPAGLYVSVDNFTFEGNVLATMRLTVGNDSTNLLTIDAGRSSFITPAGEALPLSVIVGSDFATTLLPGEDTSDTIDVLATLQSGDQLKVALVWTLGALVGSATWVWETADAAAETPAQQLTVAPGRASQPTAAPAAASQPAAAEDAGGDFLVGVVGLALGLALLGLLVWGLWSLGSLLW
jgi:hypothetical protein